MVGSEKPIFGKRNEIRPAINDEKMGIVKKYLLLATGISSDPKLVGTYNLSFHRDIAIFSGFI